MKKIENYHLKLKFYFKIEIEIYFKIEILF